MTQTGRFGRSADSILLVTSSWPRTEDELAGTFVRSDAITRARQAKVVVLAPTGPGSAHVPQGVEVIEAPHRGLFGSPGAASRLREEPSRLLGLAPFARAVAAAIARVAPTKIVAHWLVPSAAIARAVDRATPLEAIAHGADVRLLRALPRAASRVFIDRLCDRESTVIRAVSSTLAERLVDLSPSIADRVVVAPMPLATDDPELIRRVRRRAAELEVGPRPLHVVAARLVAEKRIDRALDHARDRGGSIAIVGDGPERLPLMQRASNARARFLGALPHEEALAWIAAADVVLAPIGKDEGNPTVIREARAFGVDVVIMW